MIIKHGRNILGENSRGAQMFVGFFLYCAFRVLFGWTGKLRSHGKYQRAVIHDEEFSVFL